MKYKRTLLSNETTGMYYDGDVETTAQNCCDYDDVMMMMMMMMS